MRFRSLLGAFCAAAFVLVWSGCDESSQVEQLQGPDPSFAKSGPPPAQCDVKGLPVKEYFSSKSDIKDANKYLRALTAACVDGEQGLALEAGFGLFTMVEGGRWSPDASFFEGGQIVAGVWTAMQYNGGLTDIDGYSIACAECKHFAVHADSVEAALAPGGVFGVVPGDPVKDYLFSQGDPTTVRWGIEPPGATWGEALPLLPLVSALVYGFPLWPPVDDDPPDAEVGNGFNFNVVPWHSNPWDAPDDYLLVGTCVITGAFNAMVAHRASLLPVGPGQAYCLVDDPSLAVSWGERAVRLASEVVPFWPQTLHASLFVGKSGTGKAREFSPFYGYDIAPDALTAISQPLDGPTTVGDTICFADDCGNFTFEWSTGESVDLATRETLVIAAKDNNGAWVSFEEGWGIGVDIPNLDCGTEVGAATPYITCKCDAREQFAKEDRCTGLELSNLALNKPGGYRLCVESAGDDFGSGLNIEACTNAFHISPN